MSFMIDGRYLKIELIRESISDDKINNLFLTERMPLGLRVETQLAPITKRLKKIQNLIKMFILSHFKNDCKFGLIYKHLEDLFRQILWIYAKVSPYSGKDKSRRKISKKKNETAF